MGPIAVDGGGLPGGSAQLNFSGRKMTILEVLPLFAAGFPVTGTFAAKKKSINGKASAVISGAFVSSTAKLTTRSTRSRQKVSVVYTVAVSSSGSSFVYTYAFQGSRKVKK
jgi:hypothetical protein